MRNAKTKKILSILLAVMMVVGMIPATAIPVGAATISGTTGTGTEADPIVVDTFTELKLALKYSEDLNILVENGTYIECTETLTVTGTKTLTVNGTLYGQDTVLQAYVVWATYEKKVIFVLQGDGEIHSENGYAYVHHKDNNPTSYKTETIIRGNLTFMSEENDSVNVYDTGLTIEGGTFKTNSADHSSLYLDGRGVSLEISLAGGSYPNGIDGYFSSVEIKEGYAYQYEDGSISATFRTKVPVEIVNTNYNFGFANQTPAMPEGKIEHFLGNYTVGTEAAKFTFGFYVVPLPSVLKKAGYSVTEELTVVSAKNGIIINQRSGAEYTIDNTVADTYTIIETITYSDGDGILLDTITHSFIVSIQPEGYVTDIDCPIKGATGTGTEADPIVVDTFMELKLALKYSEDLHILVENGTYIECTETLTVTGTKTLTVNGTLYGQDTVLQAYVVWATYEQKVIFVLQGDGEIHSENGYAYVHHKDNNPTSYKTETIIRGNLTFMSEENDSVNVYDTGLTIEGGTFKTNSADHSSLYLDGRGVSLDISFAGGSYPNGIDGYFDSAEIKEGYLFCYNDCTIGTTLTLGKPFIIIKNVNDFLSFATQYPAMHEGETEKDLGIKYIAENTAVSVEFTAKALPQILIDDGCTVKEELKVYDPTGKLVKSQASGAAYTVVPEIEGEYRIVESLTLTDPDGNEVTSLSHIFTFTAEKTYSVSGRISGVPEGEAITINLYKAGEGTPFKTTTAYGQGDFDINNLPLDVAFEIEGVTKGDYILEAKCNNYATYRYSFTIKDKSYVDLIFMEIGEVVVVDITGMYKTDTASVKVYEKGTDTVLHTATIKGNGSHIFTEFAKGDYTVEVSATGYKTKTSNLYIYSNDSVKGVTFEMELDPSKVDFGFGTQTPSVTDYEKKNGITNMGLVFEAPSFSFTAGQLYFKYLDMGYSVTTDIDVWLSDSVVGGGDTNHSWTCNVYDYGTKRVVEKVILLDPDGKEIATKSHTYTFTYLPLKFNTQKPSVTADDAAAGVTNLGTLTTAPTFSFSAVPIDSAALINESYSIKVKTEAYQGDILVYSAENGNAYTHVYQYQGKVVQTIELYKNNELIGTKSHTYNFNMEFPEGTLTLGNDFLSIEEGATQRITAVVMPEDLANALRWSSSNEDIVTVDNNGNVTAVRAGSAIITAYLPDGTRACCPVLVTASDVLVYVGGVGLREGEYLAVRSSIPTTSTRPADNYAYLSTVDGKLTLTLCNYNYEGTGTFISNRLTYGIYSSADLKIVAQGNNTVGPITAPLERYTSYGIGEGETISINSDDYSTLTIKGVNTGIDITRYLFINGNLNMTDVAGGVSGGNTMGRVALESGKINIDCTGTAFNLIGGEFAFDGAKVKINCNSGIRFVRTGNLWINAGRLNIFAETSGIQIKSGDSFQMDKGIVLVDANYNAIVAEDTLTINGGYMLLRSFNTASDSTYSAINGSGTVTLGTGVTGKGALTSAGSSSLTNYSESYKKHFDYLVFSESGINSFLKQPEGGSVEKGETLTVSWELTFTPVKLVLRTNDGSTNTYTELDVKTKSLELPILPEGGYYLIQAYFATSSYLPSERFYVTEVTTTLKGNISSYLGDSEFITLTLYDNNMDIPCYQYTLPGSTTSYSFPGVPYGEYVIVVEKPGHDTVAVNLIVEGESCYVDISMVLLADTNYDGELDIHDYQQLVNVILSDEYEDEPDNVYWYSLFYDLDLDGSIDVLDASLMELVINGHRNITDVYSILKGDYDGDGYEYTETDINYMYTVLSDIEAYAKQMSTAQKIAADLNYNGAVDEQDLEILKRKFSYLV